MKIYPSQFIMTRCKIVERFAPTAYRALLPNGKPTVAFIQKKEEALLQVIQEGQEVTVSISPADFDRARIISL